MTSTKQPASQVPTKCASCDSQMLSPICCQSCHTLYPVDTSIDHFALFGLPRRYDIDEQELHRRFMSISRNVHPDMFGNQDPAMQHLALRLSAQVNEAYQTIKDPISRAEYLLESLGGKSSADDKSVPGNLLAEVMMLREEIEEARQNEDTEQLTLIRSQIDSRRLKVEEQIAALAQSLTTQPTDEVRSELRKQVNAIRYLRNLLNEAR